MLIEHTRVPNTESHSVPGTYVSPDRVYTMTTSQPPTTERQSCTFRIPNMDCPACVAHVERALGKQHGVEAVHVNLVERTVRVEAETLDRESLAAELRRAGYPPTDESHAAATLERTPVWNTPAAHRTYAAAALWLIAVIADLIGSGPLLAVVSFADGWTWELTPWSILAFVGAIIGATNFVPSGLRSIRSLRLGIDALMTIAIVGAVLLGEFTEAAAIGALFSLAELLESRSMVRARDAMRELMSFSPPTALVRRGDDVVDVPVNAVRPGDTVVVRPGERIPLDGVVERGASDVNEAALTGEPMPVRKQPSDEVFAGTLTLDGYVEIRVTRANDDTVLAHVIELVRSAQEKKARIERLVTRFSRVYTPAVVSIAVLIAVLPPLVVDASWQTWVLRGLTLLVVSCPCALVISTPVSIVSAITSATRHGVVITGGQHLEALGETRAIAFDKTGTVTYGKPRVTRVHTFNADSTTPDISASETALLRIAALIEQHSAHPIASAIVNAASERGVSLNGAEVTDVTEIPGEGISGRIGATEYRIVAAEPDELVRAGIADADTVASTVVRVSRRDNGVDEALGFLVLADEIRPEAPTIIARLRAMGIREIAMLTGDNPESAKRVAEQIGVDSVRAGCMPQDKLDEIGRLRAKHGAVAMVGDGINDAPALASATVGIAMGAGGSPTALEAADIALMADDLRMLPYLVRLSRKTRRIIRQNIAISLGIKALMVVGVPFGFVSMTLAVLVGDMGTSLAVTSNAIRLVRERPEKDSE